MCSGHRDGTGASTETSPTPSFQGFSWIRRKHSSSKASTTCTHRLHSIVREPRTGQRGEELPRSQTSTTHRSSRTGRPRDLRAQPSLGVPGGRSQDRAPHRLTHPSTQSRGCSVSHIEYRTAYAVSPPRLQIPAAKIRVLIQPVNTADADRATDEAVRVHRSRRLRYVHA